MKSKFWRRLSGRCLPVALALAGVTFTLPVAVTASPIQAVGQMSFGAADTLFMADWRANEIHALHLAPVPARAAKPFNLKNISAPIAKALHVEPEQLRFIDLACRPGAELAYVALEVDQGRGVLPRPALVAVDATGQVTVINLAKTPQTAVAIKDPPAADERFWRDVPAARFTVTDMVFQDGRLYVAGLSSGSFASTLRIFPYPFTGQGTVSSIEMYHAVHNQMETRAPIRKLAIVTLNGEPTLVAAYTCTPLVTIPLRELQDGAHVVGKTVAELGWGSAPVDLVPFNLGTAPMLLLINSHKSADLISVSSLATAAQQPGLSTPIHWPDEPFKGLRATPIPMAGVAELSNQNDEFFAALRRDEAAGDMALVSIRKGAFLRLSDFINEYDFADYSYPTNDTWHGVHQRLRTDEDFADLAQRAVVK